jgi:hypothetical protein
MNRIYQFEHEGKSALGFDTGLDSRAFAQARLARFADEQALIVFPDGSTETWKAEGVTEVTGSMVIWGPPFAGNRLDLLVENAAQDEALEALVRWIRAYLAFTETRKQQIPPQSRARHQAALIADTGGAYPRGTVLFCPEQLALRCVQAEGADARIADRYAHPDLGEDEAAAFTAAALLYRVFAGTPPFSAGEETPLRQDMREGNVLPPRLAIPGLDEQLAALMERGLRQMKTGGGTVLLRQFMELLSGQAEADGMTVKKAASLFRTLSDEETRRLAEEKKRFLKRKTITIKSRRFVMRNRAIIFGCAAALIIAALVAGSVIKSRAELPSTRGMEPQAVINAYYQAFGELDHAMMDACLAKGAGKDDVDMVLNLYVINKVRQAYEMNRAPNFMSAAEWEAQGGGPVTAQVFGVSGLLVEHIAGGEETEETRWQAAYTLWLPYQAAGAESAPAAEGAAEAGMPALPQGIRHTDILTLARRRGNWRITAIERVTESPQSSD